MSKRREKINHNFVETMPEELEEGVLYVSIRHRIALHRCFCGCGVEVSTPLSPLEWKLIFDGETVSLSPSVGVWGLPCQSHYWIKRNRVHWAGKFSPEKIERVRARERAEHEWLADEKLEKRPTEAEPRPSLFVRIFGLHRG
jgi:hypothetical protein